MKQNNQAIPFNKENFKQIFSVSFVLVILISIPGAIIADFFNIPLAWFLGPMLVTSLASLMGLKIEMPRLILSSILILLGLYIGNYIDKSLFAQMHQWIWTSLIMLIYIILSVLIVSKYLQKFSKYEQKTSIFSAAPGALGPLMILAEDEKTDLSQVATSHLIRLIIIITVFPFIVNSFYDFEGVESAQKIIDNQNLSHLLILIITSVILIYFFDRLKLPAALLSGTLVASGLLQITDIAAYEISADIIDFCLLILGASVGCRFADKTFGEIGRNALHSFVATFLLVLLGLIAAFTASLIIDKNFFTLLLSYCPGGIYEVAVIAIFFDLDPEFVSFHHIIRLLMILFIVPIILKLISKKT
ncbi:AbrB family transcriptional regulator [Pelagibacteraceae bacterium]|jgi:membrane AbrB-like protein|nr:AbrB family transcriptional regulator [Pelagibacteraceae bacterium]|tara:strand:- start:829 stop:1908 length:1080 start_codon:yes stop_codon:yes gene_type:complete